MAYCNEHPLFTVTEQFLTEEAYNEVDNCQEQPVNPKRDLIETAPGVVDPRGLILQARWRDPEAKFAPPLGNAPVDEPGAVLLDGSEATVLKIAVNGMGCVPQATVTVESYPPTLALSIELGPAIDTGFCAGTSVRAHAMEVVLAQPVDLESVSLSATGAILFEDS